MADYDRDQFTAWLTASCQRQGVPVAITDPAVITQVTALLGASTGQLRRHNRPAQRDVSSLPVTRSAIHRPPNSPLAP